MSNRTSHRYGAIPNNEQQPALPGAWNDQSVFASHQPTFISSLKHIFFSSWINILLVFVPLGILSYFLKWSDTLIFVFNFLALLPMAKLLGLATEELALRTNQTIGGLLNATFGNLVELIVAILALKENLIRVVQASLLGSILSNLLLVLGAAFFAGGLRYQNQTFNQTGAQTSASLLGLTVLGLVIPAAFAFTVGADPNQEQLLLNVSRGTAIVLLLIYVLFLVFQLKTHTEYYQEQEEDTEEPELTLPVAVGLLLVITLLVSLCGEYLVGSIDAFAEQHHLNEVFVGLILLPLVGNAAEHVTAVTVALKNKTDLAIGVAIGSSMQIALLAVPVCVIAGWIMDRAMTLNFSIFESSIVFVTVFVVNSIIADGKSNWLEGAMLLGGYVIVGLAIFFLPL
ncbi:hypothetical protein HDV00_009271 [Rhizophlyctis rosea]|nr:hypothetical protein HDV00_009271 [Rhizophlyctis rosea]